jgi:hypothetical protein
VPALSASHPTDRSTPGPVWLHPSGCALKIVPASRACESKSFSLNYLTIFFQPEVELKSGKSPIRGRTICKNTNKNAYSTSLDSFVKPLFNAFCKTFTARENLFFTLISNRHNHLPPL